MWFLFENKFRVARIYSVLCTRGLTAAYVCRVKNVRYCVIRYGLHSSQECVCFFASSNFHTKFYTHTHLHILCVKSCDSKGRHMIHEIAYCSDKVLTVQTYDYSIKFLKSSHTLTEPTTILWPESVILATSRIYFMSKHSIA